MIECLTRVFMMYSAEEKILKDAQRNNGPHWTTKQVSSPILRSSEFCPRTWLLTRPYTVFMTLDDTLGCCPKE